jgi:amidase
MKKLKNNYRLRIESLNRSNRFVITSVLALSFLSPGIFLSSAHATANQINKSRNSRFQLEEASIKDIHKAIQSKQITCQGLVQAYINRAAAYNGACTSLVTADGASIPQTYGRVIAGKPQKFPTTTVPVSSILPNVGQYAGLPLDLGRMETTISDSSVMHQMGMRVGIPNAGQLNALETINIRGERSVTCKGAFDAHPSTGPLPANAPLACEEFRQKPDALERAAELDALYGSNPPLDEMPMYCVTVAAKDVYDTKDMRSTSNSDVNFAMDVPPFDSPTIDKLRSKGAIIYAKTQAHEFNAGPGNPGGSATAETNLVGTGYAMSTWSGQSCNPYDTERVPRGSSAGSGPAVSANLVMIGLCEQTAASCQGPASRSNITLLLPTQGLTADSGGQGYQYFRDRLGIHAKTVADATFVLDAIKDPKDGYFDPRGLYSAIPKGLVSNAPYASFLVDDKKLTKNKKPLAGMRIGIIREHMVTPTLNHKAITEKIDAEIKRVLRDELGAELVETIDPRYGDDPDVANLEYSFADAYSEIFPRYMPEIFSRRNSSGNLIFAVPGYDVSSYDYLQKLSLLEAPLSSQIRVDTVANIAGYPNPLFFKFEMDRYLKQRGDEKITDWASWVENAKFRQDASRAGAENWVSTTTTIAEGKSGQMAVGELSRLALLKVMYANKIDAFVHPEVTVPHNKIGGPLDGSGSLESITPNMGVPRIVVPAGYNQTVYEPEFVLNASNTDYIVRPGTQESTLPKPLPISITFFAGQGEEPTLIKISTAYETATQHRVPPPDFGPLKGDLNADGIFNCPDLALIKASFGKKTGQPSFNAAADVNLDGVVNVRDLSFVSRLLPAGTKCR